MSLISRSLGSIRGVRLSPELCVTVPGVLCIKHHLWFEEQCLSSNTAELAVGSTNISQCWWWWKNTPCDGSTGREVWRRFVGSRCWMWCWEFLGQVRSQEHSLYIQVYNEILNAGGGRGVLEVCQNAFFSSPYILWCSLKTKKCLYLSLLLLLFLLTANVSDDKNNPIRKNGVDLKRLRNVVLRQQ